MQITVLSYGSELNDFVIEGGELGDLALTKGTGATTAGGTAAYMYENLAQTFTATATIVLNSLEIYAYTIQGYDNSTGQFYERTNIPLTAQIWTGSTVGSGSLLGTLSTTILDDTERKYKMITTDTINLTNTSAYHIIFIPGVKTSSSDQTTLAIANASAYAGGSAYAYYYTI